MLIRWAALAFLCVSAPYAKGHQFEATAYTRDCFGCTGITKIGIDADPWSRKIMAVDPRILELGKCYRVRFADGHSTVYLAADVGGDIKGYRVDLLLKSKESAKKFGRQTVTIVPAKCENE